jgi:hypothetical protein
VTTVEDFYAQRLAMEALHYLNQARTETLPKRLP